MHSTHRLGSSKTDSEETSSRLGTSSSSIDNLVLPVGLAHGNYQNEMSTSQNSCSSISGNIMMCRKCQRHELPAIGVYWDIENCQVPKNKSASCLVQRIRGLFFKDHQQAEFLVVCDVLKENVKIMHELHDAQVSIMHVSSTSKNAADEKLRQSLRRFGDTYHAPATIILISGDVNFAYDINDLRYRKKFRIILIHNSNVSLGLLQHAHEAHSFTKLAEDLAAITIKVPLETVELRIANLPTDYSEYRLRNRLKLLSDNCGGRILHVNAESGTAVIRFASLDVALRAERRLNGEDVFGKKIVVNGTEHFVNTKKNNARRITKYQDGNGSQHQVGVWPNQGSGRGDWRSPVNRTSESLANFNCDHSHSLSSNTTSVELIITNLDASVRDLRNVLYNQLRQYVTVYNFTMNYQDSKPMAVVRVSSQQDAEYIISKMHHQKLGYRRISISYARPKGVEHDELKERIVYLLQQSQTKSIPLYLLLNMLDTKYLMRVSLCEINKLRDVCQIVEENGERLVTLAPQVLVAAPANLQQPHQLHYCSVHCPNGITDITLWQPDLYQPPCVIMSIKEFGLKLNEMLASHMGSLPLLSFTICYSQEFGEPLPVSASGVPLEHLVTCVSNVKLRYGNPKHKAKLIVWEMALETEEAEHFNKNASPLATSLSLLRREFVDLLRSAPKCQIPLGKFVPAYHHHFGRQLRVADYGFTKLDDLLYGPSLANVVQIMGEGSNRILTLTHSAQIRRFTSDLLRMLKSQVPKQFTLSELNEVYQRVFSKAFSATDYGVCSVEDLLDDVPENILILNRTETELTFGIPQRVRTAEEILRTRQFAKDVVKLLSHSPSNSMMFDKFIPHYHHHFGNQCKVSEYGFTKLIELFEAIPETIKVDELPNSQRMISLTPEQSLNLLGNRILDLVKKSHISYLPLDQLAEAYMDEYKVPLNLQLYNCVDLKEIVDNLKEFITISYSSAGPLVIPVQKDFLSSLALRVWSLLVKDPYHCDASKLIFAYFLRYHSTITVVHLEQLNNIVVTRSSSNEYTVFLAPEQIKAAKLYQLLLSNGGQLPFSNLEFLYQREYGEKLLLDDEHAYEKFLNSYSFMLILSRSRKKTSVALNPKLAELNLPVTQAQDQNGTEPSSQAWILQCTAVMPTSATRNSPPKPDTPPVLNASELLAWQTQLTPIHDKEFSISMPPPETPMYLPNPNTLISPAKNLLPAHPMGSVISYFPAPPNASELPSPDSLLKRGLFSDDSGDSGVNNSHNASENEMEVPQATVLGAKPKYPRKKPEFSFNL